MDRIKRTAFFAGLGLAAVFGLNQGAGWAGIPDGGTRQSQWAAITEAWDPKPVTLARGGGRGGGGNSWGGGDNSGSGSGYGAKNGSGSGDCDGSGPKGNGGKGGTN